MNATKTCQLFSPVKLGATRLKHRVVMAPLTRSRSNQPEGIPGDLMLEYYTQRASDGGLIISEANQLSLASQGWHGAPGLYPDAQVSGWERIVNAVHAKGGHIFAELWHPGRFSHVSLTGGATHVSASVDHEYWENPSRLISTPSGWIQPSPHRSLEKSEISAVLESSQNASHMPSRLVSTELRSMPAMVTSSISFFRMAVINERMNTAAQLKTAPGCSLKWSKL